MSLKSLHILYEDRHVLVCVKPPGTATQSKNIRTPDMVSLLKNHIAESPSSENLCKEPYLAVIHRLDQPVQGVMVFAKTPFAAGELSKELQAGGFGKHYRALVENPPAAPCGTLENYLQKDARTNRSCICRKGTPGSKYAKLNYHTVTENHRYFSLPPAWHDTAQHDTAPAELDIHLHTGRHHQIRIQLAHIGCPIIGDTKYNPEKPVTSMWQELKLCSYCLEFTHPKTKKSMHFSLL